jgi:hypothetical protein
MYRSRFLSVIIGCFLLSQCACTIGQQAKDGTVITTNANMPGNKITVRFTRGTHFSTIKRIGVMKIFITPQIAVWVEDTSGNLIQTLFVTHKFGKQDWGIVPHDKDVCFRTSSLPCWLNKYHHAGNAMPTTNKPLPDGITAATPPGSFDINTTITPSNTAFVIMVEINSSFDANEVFSAKRRASKINGQPAVVFAARVNLNTLIDPIITMRLSAVAARKERIPCFTRT